MWILIALREGPLSVERLLDDVRRLDGQVGPGTLYGAVARLERLALIEPMTNDRGRRAYRLGNAARQASAVATEGGMPS
jgi:DNA-binding PadR family transcriptional regulator